MIPSIEFGAPCLLIKQPQHHEHALQPFFRAVVLMVQHGSEGSMGLTLTRPTETTVDECVQGFELSMAGSAGQQLVRQGGPVDTSRIFLAHASAHQGPETELLWEDVRLSFSLETLKLLVDSPPNDLIVLQGYAGWGAGQLARELAQGLWLVAPVDKQLLFETTPDKLWEEALRRQNIVPLYLGSKGSRN